MLIQIKFSEYVFVINETLLDKQVSKKVSK